MREWFVSSELLGLDGMPNTIEGISQKSRRNNWLRRKASGQGRAFEYHISNFHTDVKKQLIGMHVTSAEEARALMVLPKPNLTAEDGKEVASNAERSNVRVSGDLKLLGEMRAVPVYNVYASCGFGSLNDSEYQLRTELIPGSWLQRLGLTEETARIIICEGDSMENTLSDGDEVLVDTRELEHPVKHGVYVVRIGKHVYVKRLKYDIMAEGYEVISDNKEEYDSFIVNGEKLNEFAVIGKVVTTVIKAVV